MQMAGRLSYALLIIQLDDLLILLLICRPDTLSLTPIPKTFSQNPTIGHIPILGHFDSDPGSSSLSYPSWKPANPDTPSNATPLAELSRQDPILFNAEVPLFEYELHDNGASVLVNLKRQR